MSKVLTKALAQVVANQEKTATKERASTGRMRVRITKDGKYATPTTYHAKVVKTAQEGSLDIKLVSKEKQKEVEEAGFAYVSRRRTDVV